jgi:hypothetical protein
MEVIVRPNGPNPNALTKFEFEELNKLLKGRNSAPVTKVISHNKIGAGLGRPEYNKIVQGIAIEATVNFYKKKGYKVTDVSNDNLEWDITATKSNPKQTLHIEVNGLSGTKPEILLTRNEMRKAKEDPDWKLAIVTEALKAKPQVRIYDAEEVQTKGKPFMWEVKFIP